MAEPAPRVRRSRPPHPTLESVILRLELLGYAYKGVDYNDGAYLYVTFDPPVQRGNVTANMLGGRNWLEIMERMDELPILNPDPLVRSIEARTRRR